ncbi:isoamyl acetate-hydrolyzing esterase [Coemansia sp. RSA 1797]|nr:isoamyl acetate-hydrolyzing esterase [Coemansia sp. RSA 1878]KAJ2591275.1 isoamyl acetate-hydrolyzing esterase [Coemansia sp. RSA 1797]
MQTSAPTLSQSDGYRFRNYDTLLALGDSVTQRGYDPNTGGFLARLADLYQRQMDIMNRGLSGYNSLRALKIVQTILPKTRPPFTKRSAFPPALSQWIRPTSTASMWQHRGILPGDEKRLQMLFIFIGANDARLPSKTDSSTLEEYQANLHAIISLLRDPDSEYYSPKTRILIITPPPIGELMIQSYTPTFAADPFVFNNRTRLFAEMAKQVAREAGVPSIDLYSEIENRVREEQATGTWSSTYDGYDNYLVDGVHLNNKGNMLLFNLIITTFQAVWPEMLPKTLPS